MTTAIPTNQRATGSAHEDAPALVQQGNGGRWQMTDAVELGGREGQVAAAARVPDQAGGPDPAETGPQAFVLVEEVGRHGLGGDGPSVELAHQLGVDGLGGLGEGG